MGFITKFVSLFIAVYISYNLLDRFEPESIKEKRVVITGASTGIGEQIAYQYAKLGARILITSRREAVLQEVAEYCMKLGAKEAIYLALDMGKENDTKMLIEEAREKFGGLDHLILNHITANYLKLYTGDLKRLRKTLQINFYGYVSLATYATPMLAESKGSIGVLSSFAGSIDTPNAVKYSKHVLDSNRFKASAASTAYRIMTGTSCREREVFYPWYETRPPLLLRELAPGLLDRLIEMNFKTTGDKT